MITQLISKKSNPKEYLVSVLSICIIASITYPLSNIIGYRAVALILLATVSVLAMILSIYPVFLAALLSALIWDFFFIPPHFTFHVEKTEDALMLIMYFIIALINGVLSTRIRKFEKIIMQREEKANTLKLYKTLFNSISHELRTPIATIIGATDNLLQQDNKLSENNKQKLLLEINIASERLNGLVENLLNMSRVETGFIQPKKDWCDLNDLINQVIKRLAKIDTSHVINVNLPEDLPLYKLDFGLMEQAIYNIVYNSVVYTPVDATISIQAENRADACVVTISDNGQGIPEENIDKIFNKFYRSESNTAGGLGLGLSISKGFIEIHDGKITVENQKDSGVKFQIIIPCETITVNNSLSNE